MDYRIQLVAIVSFVLLFPNTQGWGDDGHAIICKIAQVPSYFSFSSSLSVPSSACFTGVPLISLFLSVLNRLASAIRLLRLWKSCSQSLQKMTCRASAHGLIMSGLSIPGHLFCTLPILRRPFAVTTTTVSSLLVLLPMALFSCHPWYLDNLYVTVTWGKP